MTGSNLWSETQSNCLGSHPALYRVLGACEVLSMQDEGKWFSIPEVVAALNNGELVVPQGLCILFSKADSSYCLLWCSDRELESRNIFFALEALDRQMQPNVRLDTSRTSSGCPPCAARDSMAGRPSQEREPHTMANVSQKEHGIAQQPSRAAEPTAKKASLRVVSGRKDSDHGSFTQQPSMMLIPTAKKASLKAASGRNYGGDGDLAQEPLTTSVAVAQKASLKETSDRKAGGEEDFCRKLVGEVLCCFKGDS
jgi:hypothetical protein